LNTSVLEGLFKTVRLFLQAMCVASCNPFQTHSSSLNAKQWCSPGLIRAA